jgi:dipeptidyl aminopeptidase/acylaminoacyl peptidase
MVIHGANDPRVPVGEAEQMVNALRSRGQVVEYLRFEDEGHGLVKLPNRVRAYTAVAAFLDRTMRAETLA